jgi:hypothetical protein
MQTIKLTLNESQLASVMIAVNKELANAQTVTDQEFSNESTRILIQSNIERFYKLNNDLTRIAYELLRGKTSFDITKT